MINKAKNIVAVILALLFFHAAAATAQVTGIGRGSDLAAACTAIGAVVKTTLYINSEIVIAADLDISAYENIYFKFIGAGAFAVASGKTLTLYRPANIDAPWAKTIFSGDGSVLFDAPGKASAMWAEALSDGSTDDAAAIQKMADSLTAGGTLYFPKGSSFYPISATIDIDTADNLTIEAEKGAEIRLTATTKHGLNITKNFVTVSGLTMEGEGTYVSNNDSEYALIYSTGDDTTIEKCYLKEPETAGIYTTGDRAVIKDNIIEGGPYFADLAAIGTDRQHYGILVKNSTNNTISGNIVKQNSEANAGAVIQGICTVAMLDSIVSNNRTSHPWQHGLYSQADGCTFSNNILTGGGLKVWMLQAYVKGNTITGNKMDDNSPFFSDNGIILVAPKNSTISANSITRVQNFGININVLAASPTDTVVGNSITGNTIEGITTSSHGSGIYAAVTQTFSNNVISGNTIRNCGTSTTGINAGISTQELADAATHTNNVIANNSIYDSYETGMWLSHLTGALVTGNTIQGVGVDAADAAIYLDDTDRSVFRGNFFHGDANMDYAFRDSATETSEYNTIEGNTWYALNAYPIRQSGTWSATNLIRSNDYGTGGVSTYTTAGDRAPIAYGDIRLPVHLRDPNGAARTDTTDTAANINARVLFYDGMTHEITYLNTGESAETITIAGGTGVTIFNSEGAADAVIPAGSGAKLLFLRTSSTTVSVFVTVFEAV